MGMKSVGFVALALLACGAGCASIAPGKYARPIDEHGQLAESPRTPAGLKVSAREIRSLASEHFGFVEVTFENTTSRWVHIHRVELGFGDPVQDRNVYVPWGTELESWRRAIDERNRVRETNAETALAALALSGALVAAASSDRGAKAAGGLVAAGAVGTAIVMHTDQRVSAAQDAKPFPEAHLLELPFPVPPGLHSKRWIVLNTPANIGCIHSMTLAYESDNGHRERVWADFRSRGSEWQRKVCPRMPERRRR
jgi:hypothetical protein